MAKKGIVDAGEVSDKVPKVRNSPLWSYLSSAAIGVQQKAGLPIN